MSGQTPITPCLSLVWLVHSWLCLMWLVHSWLCLVWLVHSCLCLVWLVHSSLCKAQKPSSWWVWRCAGRPSGRVSSPPLPSSPINTADSKKAEAPDWFIRLHPAPRYSGIIKVWGYFLNGSISFRGNLNIHVVSACSAVSPTQGRTFNWQIRQRFTPVSVDTHKRINTGNANLHMRAHTTKWKWQ